MRKIILFMMVMVLLYSQNIKAQWSELGGLNGLAANNSIHALCCDAANNIYAAGKFINANGNYYVARWNGSSWSELGGLNALGANGWIMSICSDNIGNIYAAGNFQNVSGKKYIAKWDGNSWNELGGLNGLAANGDILSICSDISGNIYAAGFFTNSTGNEYVAKWNGSSWTELGGLNGLAANSWINSICSDASGNIYAAGAFSNGINQWLGKRFIAKWNGNNWNEFGCLIDSEANNEIYSICSDTIGNIYAAGNFNNSSGYLYVAKCNDSSWTQLNNLGVASMGIKSLCTDVYGSIYAAGTFENFSGNVYVAKWNVNTWSELGGYNSLGVYSWVYTLCSDFTGNIYAAGQFTNSNGNWYVAKYHNNTAVNDLPTSSITISPNPTTGIITIKGITQPMVAVYNLMGQKVVAAQGSNEVSLAQLPAGMYLVQVFNKDMELVKSEKIILNR